MSTSAEAVIVPKSKNTDIERCEQVFNLQKLNLQALKNTTAKERKAKLKKLMNVIIERKENIQQAIYKDFRKAPSEVDILEIYPTLTEIRHTRKHLSDWMRTETVSTPMTHFGSSAEIMYEPKGRVLIISPWNYPFFLAIGPLVSAIAAGNSVIIKPSEFTPNTASEIKILIELVFPENEVAVIEGDHEIGAELLKLPFDHIFFTGSPAVGKIVMGAAAKNLTSVTLELGGKSPVIVDESAKIKDAAQKISWGKLINSGQTCIAPDYLLVHEKVKDELITEIIASVKDKYERDGQDIISNGDYCRIVNRKHHQRISALIEDAIEKGAKVLYGSNVEAEQNFIAPTILTDISEDAEIMQEEIFGPVLPVFTYKNPQEAVDFIQKREKPLAFYVFSKNNKNTEFYLKNTTSGGVLVNDTILHVSHQNLPFGGVNNSGIGNAHGIFGFKAFSHEKSVMRQNTVFSLAKFMHPPYNKFTKRLIDFTLKYF
ncbi:MAG: aldehyde dehydrogenase family protein [Chitinophagaceae bacterium]|nr:MAG: aldehyde dehydrogenase family protein [Chitinophagaceae bacterium]